MAIQIKILIFSIVLAGCTLVNPIELEEESKNFNGTYSTFDIRSMWHICSFKYRAFKVAEPIYTPLCDCSIDYMRKNYTSEEVAYLSENESYKIGPIISEFCSNQIQKPKAL